MMFTRYLWVFAFFVLFVVGIVTSVMAQGGLNSIFLPYVIGGGKATIYMPAVVGGSDVQPSATPTPSVTPTASTTPTPSPTPTSLLLATATTTATTDPNATATPTETTIPGSPTPAGTATPTNTPVFDADCVEYGEGAGRSSRFGVQMFEDSRPANRNFPWLVSSGAGWLRVLTPWGPTEPRNTTPAEYDWRWVDRELGAVSHVNIQTIGTIGFAPAWAASNPNGVIDKATLADFTEFVGALVERYDGDSIDDAQCSPVVQYWEFYNEPDHSATYPVGYFRNAWGEAPVQYAEMLRAVYPVVKAANPNAQVVFGGIAYEWFFEDGGRFVREFTDRVLQQGTAPYFDVMNFHVYPEFWQVHAEQPPGLLEKTSKIRAILQRNGVTKPLIITETGSHSNSWASLNMTEELQARYVPQLFAQSIAANVDVTIWFMLYDTPDGVYPYKNGLVTADDVPVRKLSFDAYRVAWERFESASFVRVVPLEERGRADLHIYEFLSVVDGRSFYLAWLTPIDTSNQVPLKLAAESLTVRNLYGVDRTVTDAVDGQDDGFVTIAVGGQPLYIEVP